MIFVAKPTTQDRYKQDQDNITTAKTCLYWPICSIPYTLQLESIENNILIFSGLGIMIIVAKPTTQGPNSKQDQDNFTTTKTSLYLPIRSIPQSKYDQFNFTTARAYILHILGLFPMWPIQTCFGQGLVIFMAKPTPNRPYT